MFAELLFECTSTAQKMKFFLRISSVMRIWSHLLKKFLGENFICYKRSTINKTSTGRSQILQKMSKQKNSALNLLSDRGLGGVLPLDQCTYNILQRKHSEGSPKNANVLLEGPFQKASPEIHDKITPTLKTKGATGPPCFDGDDWRQIIGINTQGTDGNNLRKAIV